MTQAEVERAEREHIALTRALLAELRDPLLALFGRCGQPQTDSRTWMPLSDMGATWPPRGGTTGGKSPRRPVDVVLRGSVDEGFGWRRKVAPRSTRKGGKS